MNLYDIVIASPDSTVVSAYTPAVRERPAAYQSEAQMESDLIAQLATQGYEVLTARDEEALIVNLRRQIERLNAYTFTDGEWQRFLSNHIAKQRDSLVEKTQTIQRDHVKVLIRDDGSSKNITLIDKKQIHNNALQVTNQYATSAGKRASRYDVTILVNGLPLVHIELKRRGVAIKQAFNQIERYNRESFGHSYGLFEYVQLYVISNGTSTKYYSNTTRERSISERRPSQQSALRKSSHSFEFTSFWADANNQRIEDIVDFTATFLSKHTLLNVLTKYCVLDSSNELLVMRPYQIVATERILKKIAIAQQYGKSGTLEAGGYIWHTTGSGKTLTSFKVAQLASELAAIDKVVFVVDRKDLDYQTVLEYDRYAQGSANSNRSTRVLERQLSDSTSRIIVTTIQKLDTFVSQHKSHPAYGKRIVLIFDECHRSQFGSMHIAITRAFKHYYLFGFTGTPIFAANAGSQNSALRTTAQAFGDRLHAYTIVDAIHDENVLPFKVEYINTVKARTNVSDQQVSAIDTERAMLDPARLREVVNYILTHFNQKTSRNAASYYDHKQRRVNGFNSMLAVSSIPAAMRYYDEVRRQLQERGPDAHLSVAVIFSYGANDALDDTFLGDEELDVTKIDDSARDFLDRAIRDYNQQFHTNYSTSDDQFENYYKDISRRMKERELDLLIVVNMFLTGFDATTLNTLWVDKNLRQHGLIQAFSRTNRILNAVKKFGNIVCFRDLQEAVDDAIALFGNKEARGIVLLKSFEAYYYGYHEHDTAHPGYTDMVAALHSDFPLGHAIMGEQAKKDFITLFGQILRRRNILVAFDQFADLELLSERDLQDYQSRYIDLYDTMRTDTNPEKAVINEDLIFEIELIRQVDIGIDYILNLVERFKQAHGNDKQVLDDRITKAIGASMQMRSKKELIERFIATVSANSDIVPAWQTFVQQQKAQELAIIIESERLAPEATMRLMADAFEAGALRTTGVDIDGVLPAMSRFGGQRAKTKQRVIERLLQYFEMFYGV